MRPKFYLDIFRYDIKDFDVTALGTKDICCLGIEVLSCVKGDISRGESQSKVVLPCHSLTLVSYKWVDSA